MIINDANRKSIVGKLIRLHRVKRKDNTQNEFTQKRFCQDICSVRTLRSIENGNVIHQEGIYTQLLNKIGLKYNCFPEVDVAINNLMINLYEVIEYYDLENIIKHCKKATNLIYKIKDYVYYHELYEIFINTLDYYEKDIEISLDTMNWYMHLYPIYPEIYTSLLKRLIYARATVGAVDDLKYFSNIILHLNLIENEFTSMQSLMMFYYYINKQYIELAHFIKQLEKNYISQNNYNRLIDVYEYAFLLYTIIEKNKRPLYMKKCLLLIEKGFINARKISELYVNYACSLFLEEDYNQALQYFYLLQDVTAENYLPHTLYIADSLKHLNRDIVIPQVNPEQLKKYSKPLQSMYQYYATYYEMNYSEKQEFIMNNIAPFLSDNTLIKIFRNELRSLLPYTNCYKDLASFDNLIEINRKVDKI